MRIGLLVDGEAEMASLPPFLRRCESPCGITTTVKGDIQPLAPAGQIALAVRRLVPIFMQKRIELLIVLIDRENGRFCPGERALDIQEAIRDGLGAQGDPFEVTVVIKNRVFENWLVADVDALRRMPQRFMVSKKMVQQIALGGADGVDAIRVLKTCCIRRGYEKKTDAQRILYHAEPLKVARNSRSFRRLLRVLRAPEYTSQSQDPA